MKGLKNKRRNNVLTFFLILNGVFTYAQPELVLSIQRKPNAWNDVYCSLKPGGNILLMNAADYHLYAVDMNTRNVLWNKKTSIQTNYGSYLVDSILFTPCYSDGFSHTLMLNPGTGNLIDTLRYVQMYTRPQRSGDMLYFTGLWQAGNMIAYNLKADSVQWYKFIAHGIDQRPVYLKDRIIVNIEGNNWITLGYNGIETDKKCQTGPEDMYKSRECIRKADYFTQNGTAVRYADVDRDLFPDPEFIKYRTDGPLNWYFSESAVVRSAESKKGMSILCKLKLFTMEATEADSTDELVAGDKTIQLKKGVQHTITDVFRMSDTQWVLVCPGSLLVLNFAGELKVREVSLGDHTVFRAFVHSGACWFISGIDYGLYYQSLK
jgi:hypothetical protein